MRWVFRLPLRQSTPPTENQIPYSFLEAKLTTPNRKSMVNPPKSPFPPEITDYGVDRLSSLPCPILIDILSLLPIHTTVATGVLSRQWRGLWTQVPDFVIDTDDFPNQRSDFFTAIDGILQQNTSPEIRRFKLHVRAPKSESGLQPLSYWVVFSSHLGEWITQVCRRNGKEIEVIADNYVGVEMSLPHCLFQCQYLVVLKLSQGFDINLPDEINLPKLKKLDVNIRDSHRDLMQRLFRSCPSLEDLVILGMFSEDRPYFIDISAPNLKNLSVRIFMLSSETVDVAVDAQNLEFFGLYDICVVKFRFIKPPSKFLTMDLSGSVPPDDGRTLELFRMISSVRALRLDTDLVHALSCLDDPKLPMFSNLAILTMPVSCQTFEKALMVLLHSCPNLKYLDVRLNMDLSSTEIVQRTGSDSPPTCLLTHVQEMKITLLEISENEVELIKYLLSNANVLERLLVVKLEGGSEDKDQMENEIKLFEDLCKTMRSSSSCCLEFRGTLLTKKHVQVVK